MSEFIKTRLVASKEFIKDDFDGTCCSSSIEVKSSGYDDVGKDSEYYELGQCSVCGNFWSRVGGSPDIKVNRWRRSEFLFCKNLNNLCNENVSFDVCKKCNMVSSNKYPEVCILSSCSTQIKDLRT